MKKVFALIVFILPCLNLMAQTSSDALERGIRIKNGENIYLYFDGESIKYDVNNLVSIINEKALVKQLPDFTSLSDSTLFLVSSPFNIKIIPLNPLNFSFSNKITFEPDPVDAAFSEAISQLIGTISSLDATENIAQGARGKLGNSTNKCDTVNHLLKKTISISTSLKIDFKDSIEQSFGELKKINFRSFEAAEKVMTLVTKKVARVESHYKGLAKELESFADSIPKIACGTTELEKFIIKKTFKDVYDELNDNYSDQVKRFGNLKNALKLVNEVYNSAKENNGYHDIDEVLVSRGKIKYLELTINETGYELSDDKKEIVKAETKVKTKKVLVFQRFRRIVPEIAAGVAYADLMFPSFIGSTDSLGVTRVSKGASEIFNRLTFDVMINFNYYIPNSDISPFLQIGVGSNSDFPTLFSGIGIRIHSGAFKRVSLSGGFAGTWMQKLRNLKIGEVINEAADVENDIFYDFKWGQPYFGIQYNF